MTSYVVDASVAAKWLFDERGSNAARRLLARGRQLFAPDLIMSEFGNVAWKRTLRREITSKEAIELVADFLRMPLQIVSSSFLLEAAIELAIQTGRTVYDCLYLALAIREHCRLVTADERFVHALANTPFSRHIRRADQIA